MVELQWCLLDDLVTDHCLCCNKRSVLDSKRVIGDHVGLGGLRNDDQDVRLDEIVQQHCSLHHSDRRDSQRQLVLHVHPCCQFDDVWSTIEYNRLESYRRKRYHPRRFQQLDRQRFHELVHVSLGRFQYWYLLFRRSGRTRLPLLRTCNVLLDHSDAQYVDRHHGRHIWENHREQRCQWS